MRTFALALFLLSVRAYRPGDAKRAARAGASAPEELKDRQHVVDELSGCIASLNSETKALSHAIGVIATLPAPPTTCRRLSSRRRRRCG